MSGENSKVSKHWGEKEPIRDSTGFYTSPILRPYFIENAYGKELVEEYASNSYYAEDIFIDKYLKKSKIKSVLSICCGFGSIERRFVSKLDSVKECLGVDISEGAIEVAQTRAKEENLKQIKYEQVDLNNYEWEENKYDLVIANGALHHLKSLEKVFEGIKHTLKPNGLIYSCEYVGPNYQDYGVRQLELVNACSFLVPPELRARKPFPINIDNECIFRIMSTAFIAANRDIPSTWKPWKKLIAKFLKLILMSKKYKLRFGVVYRSPKKHFLRTDPSECVRSSDIIPTIKKFFPNIEIHSFGGGILHHALDMNFYLKFDETNQTHVDFLNLLCSIERQLMDTKQIGIENAYLIGKCEK